jgi:hypothetical protein
MVGGCGRRAAYTTRWGLALVGRVEASSRSVISGSMSLAYVVEWRVGGHGLAHSQITFCDLPRAVLLRHILWRVGGLQAAAGMPSDNPPRLL